MNNIPNILKDQSRSLQQLIDIGEHLQEKLDELDTNARLYEYNAWHQRVLTTFTPLLYEMQQEDILKEIKNISPTSKSIAVIRGRMFGMLQDIEQGKLNHLVHRIQKESIEDLLVQADELLVGDGEEVSNHSLAAMCAGIILESAVRKLCERKGIVPENSKWKPLTHLIHDLEENSTFNEHQAAELKIWKNIRNNVSHGQFEKFTHSDIEKMIDGIKRFVDEYL